MMSGKLLAIFLIVCFATLCIDAQHGGYDYGGRENYRSRSNNIGYRGYGSYGRYNNGYYRSGNVDPER